MEKTKTKATTTPATATTTTTRATTTTATATTSGSNLHLFLPLFSSILAQFRCREGPEGVSRTPFLTVVFWSPLFALSGSILAPFWPPFWGNFGLYF